jgi:ferredoxin
MATLKVTVNRDECISCGACWSDAPEFFVEAEDDGLTEIAAAYRVGGDRSKGEAPEDMADGVRDAADDCPVEIIEIEE